MLSIASLFPKGIAEVEVEVIIKKLQLMGAVTLSEDKVSYVL
jgi:hypothetical protein